MASRTTMDSNALDDEDVWLSAPAPLNSGLLDLERELRCPICKEFFNNPVSILPCHHTFCSECIRTLFTGQVKSITRTARCASCKAVVNTQNDKCYIPNRTANRLVGIFTKTVRDPLLNALVRQDGGKECKAIEQDATKTLDQPDPALEDLSTPTNRRSSRLSSAEAVNNRKSPDQPPPPPHPLPPPAEVSVLRRKRSKPHYSSKNKVQLRQLCRDEGLSDAGKESELRQRHEDFLTLYNAEADSYTPRPTGELVRIIHERESAKAKQHFTAGPSTNILKMKPSDKKLAPGYQKMIEQLKLQRLQKKGSSSPESAPSTEVNVPEAAQVTTTTAHPLPPLIPPQPSHNPYHGDTLRSNPPQSINSITEAVSANGSKRKAPLSQSHLNFDKRQKEASRKLSSTVVSPLPWTCQRCTFLNKPTSSRRKCEMCDAPQTIDNISCEILE